MAKEEKNKSGAGKFFLGALIGTVAGLVASRFVSVDITKNDDDDEEDDEDDELCDECECVECDCEKKETETKKTDNKTEKK